MKIFEASSQYCVSTVEYSQTIWNSKYHSMISHRLLLGRIPSMHVNGPYGYLQKMFNSCIDMFYASPILFTVIGYHLIPTEIDI